MPRKRKQPKPRNRLIKLLQEQDPARYRTRVVKPKRGKGAKPESRADCEREAINEWGNDWSECT